MHALVDDVFAVIVARRSNATIDAIAALGELGATEHLVRAEGLVGDGYASHLRSAHVRATERTGD